MVDLTASLLTCTTAGVLGREAQMGHFGKNDILFQNVLGECEHVAALPVSDS